ncbi:MAG: hypothetical protein D6734_02200 [Candidatus Schekmanbacteria bacterium]|nr:MAG: hypothetical protein D6734_02200 [Candidatus Schekmanbacteria bacterium]
MKRLLTGLFLIALIVLYTVKSGSLKAHNLSENDHLERHDQKRIVLITFDTLRYDHLGCAGYERNTSPNIDAFARKGVLFTEAYSALPTTDPAHTSILTGLYPRVHGIMGNGYEITRDDIFSLALWAKNIGIEETAAIVSRAHLNPQELGIKGFDYISAPEDERSADKTFHIVKNWLRENGKKSYFLWIHFFDPHYDYNPPYPFNSIYNDGYRGQIPKDREFLDDPPLKYNPQEIEYMISLYDGEIAFMDYYFGKTIREIEGYIREGESLPLYVVVSDHGEDMAELQERENYAFDHGEYLFNPTIKVLTVFRWDNKIKSGKRIGMPIQQIDIAPTIVELCEGNPFSFTFNGKSLANMLRGEMTSSDRERHIFVQRRKAKTILRPFLAEEQIALIDSPWKLIASFPSERVELYNLDEDRNEIHNVAFENKGRAISMLNEIKMFREKYPYDYSFSPEISPEKSRDLKALGYIQ